MCVFSIVQLKNLIFSCDFSYLAISGPQLPPPNWASVQAQAPGREKKNEEPKNKVILLMVRKSGDHQLRLVVYPIIYRVFSTSQVVGNGISEPSTVVQYFW